MSSERAKHHWPDDDDPASRMLREMYDADNDTMVFRVNRSPEVYEPGTSFSTEAMEDMNQLLQMWPWARMMRAWDRTGVAPQHMEIAVSMRILEGPDDEG